MAASRWLKWRDHAPSSRAGSLIWINRSLDRRRRRRLGVRRGKQLRRIDRVEAVLLAAEVAADLDLAALGDDAIGLLAAQPADHVGHPFAAAGAGEARCLRF